MMSPDPKTEHKQLALDLGHATSFAQADFIVTEANRLAYNHIVSFPRWATPLSLVTGPAKAGKSHLACIWSRRAQALVPGVDEIEGVAKDGGQGPVVLDDVDRAGIEERALFHLLNQSIRDRRPLLMTAREPILAWPYATDDVKSRARLAAHFTVQGADDAQLAQMFVKLFNDRQVSVDPKIISFLVARMERSPEEVVILTKLMDELALSRSKPITRTIASEVLEARARQASQRGRLRGASEEGSE
ncbi:MAG TPA: hypothetical protein ENJ90_09400 [Devosia sp.]|nr:hypothetical protein [Devosia sp.]